MSDLLKTYKKITPEMLIINDKIIEGKCASTDCKTCPHVSYNNITGASCNNHSRAIRLGLGISGDPAVLAYEFKEAYDDACKPLVEDIDE